MESKAEPATCRNVPGRSRSWGIRGRWLPKIELGGTPASGFLGVTGTAANASELGGTPASGFIHGGGNISDGRLSLLPGADEELVSAPGSAIVAYCATAGDSLYLLVLNQDMTSYCTLTWGKCCAQVWKLSAASASLDRRAISSKCQTRLRLRQEYWPPIAAQRNVPSGEG